MRQRIRVAQIIYGFGVEGGGAGRFAIDLSRSLNPEMFEVSIYSLWDLGLPAEAKRMKQLREQGYNARAAAGWRADSPYGSFTAAWRGLHRILKENPVDVLHSHSEFGDVAALLAHWYGQAPVILRTVHNGYEKEWRKRPLRRLLLTHLLYPLQFQCEIGVSQHITRQLDQRPLAKLLKRKAYCFYNAIDLDRLQGRGCLGEKKTSLDLPESAFVMGSVGRLAEEKGFRFLIEAAAQVCSREENAYFVIIGEGPLGGDLRRQAQKAGLEQRIIFTGYRTDIEELLPCLDLFISSSLWEGLPTAILESMAAGVPVIATGIPANMELVLPGLTGWRVPPSDAFKLAEAISSAIHSPEDRKAFSNRSRELVKRFSIQTVAAQHQDLYAQMHRMR